MEFLESLGPWIGEHKAIIITVGAMVYEVVGRIWPTVKRASLFSWLGKFLIVLTKVSWEISDILSKILPDKRAIETPEPQK